MGRRSTTPSLSRGGRSIPRPASTQLTDVESEGNGLVTYDRAVNKVNPERAAAANAGKFNVVKEVAPKNE